MYFIAKNIIAARESKGLNQSELARLLGITPQAVQKWEQGKSIPKGKRLEALAAALGVPVTELFKMKITPLSEEELARQQEKRNRESPRFKQTMNIALHAGQVPLISWVKAGDFEETVDIFHPGYADEWIPIYDKKVGTKTFALRVVGDSMTSGANTHPSFQPGDIIICDPEAGANAGDFVIAKDQLTQEATFKKLTCDAGRWFLTPINEKYQAIAIDREDLVIIAKVVQKLAISNF